MTFSPLLNSIIEREGIAVLSDDHLDAFLAANGDVILLVAGDHERLMEVNDAAVILPELVKASAGHLTPAVVARSDERLAQRRYRFSRFPTFVFLRNGGYLGALSQVLDWADYVTEINAILKREVSEPPAFKMPGGFTPPSEQQPANIKTKLIEEGADNV
ncbi:hydrogenase-1 expression HyaE [uncultured Cohaesibacter sp.]|uniref:hydrogenase-1 expression HyaE n=1 Tax=uncultured Cohaesibacter sp. TaxID=1002546 RepID=UPI0029C7FF22|nr:hydrogenase-1 expression HyaE [uncultured Cohaesibacter sp.]